MAYQIASHYTPLVPRWMFRIYRATTFGSLPDSTRFHHNFHFIFRSVFNCLPQMLSIFSLLSFGLLFLRPRACLCHRRPGHLFRTLLCRPQHYSSWRFHIIYKSCRQICHSEPVNFYFINIVRDEPADGTGPSGWFRLGIFTYRGLGMSATHFPVPFLRFCLNMLKYAPNHPSNLYSSLSVYEVKNGIWHWVGL